MPKEKTTGKPAVEEVFFTVEEALAAGADLRTVLATGVKPPEIEDVLRDPAKWNADWERMSHITPIHWYRRELRDQKLLSKAMLDARYAGYPVLMRQTVDLQISIIQNIYTFRYLGFDEKWLRANPAVREKHVLVGLTTSCAAAHNLHHARRLCPRELNVPRLTKDGKFLIDLLKSVVPEDLTAPPTQVKHFAHLDWDALRKYHDKANPKDADKLCHQEMLMLRTKLICHVLESTFRSFLGLEVNNIKLSKVHAIEKKLKSPENYRTFVPPGAQLSRTGCHSKTCRNGMYRAVDIPKEQKFLRCGPCWKTLLREVKYCSRECQKEDWKPNHKAICGKPLDFDTMAKIATPATSPPSSVVGPAVAGFTRSTALSYLISQLCLRPEADYLIMPTPTTDQVIDFDVIDFVDAEAKALFRSIRDKALTSGDREAVAMIAHAICWWASLEGYGGPVSPNIVVEQIRVEFAFESAKVAVIEMEQRQIRDPLKRPPFLWKMDPTAWIDFCKRHQVGQNQIKFMNA
ncbi:hypothetical protein B0H16DRAFT_1632591 [Mycena metata]|uniref:MYND-type domain-containing protein n=1 Tax=Mycena metata TaxID=1033252 RepID=A0AAD7GZG9_9AGAR|nr:hypothetical protein B0H16DRAFT_1632591 [Mycena metata]